MTADAPISISRRASLRPVALSLVAWELREVVQNGSCIKSPDRGLILSYRRPLSTGEASGTLPGLTVAEISAPAVIVPRWSRTVGPRRRSARSAPVLALGPPHRRDRYRRRSGTSLVYLGCTFSD